MDASGGWVSAMRKRMGKRGWGGRRGGRGAHSNVAPSWIRVQALVDVVLQRHRQAVHERRAGSDGVGVEHLVLLGLGHLDALLLELLP